MTKAKTFFIRLGIGVWFACALAGVIGGITNVAGCSTLQANPAATSLIVQVATVKFIEEKPKAEQAERASKVIAVVDKLQTVITGEPVTLQRVAQIALSYLPESMPPAERVLATSLINVIQAELAKRTGVGELQSDSLVHLANVLQTVEDTARLYSGS